MPKIQFLFSTLYQKLGVQQYDSPQIIKAAYIKLAKQHHPDVQSDSNIDFKDLTNAYNILKDPIKRQQYDQTINITNNTTTTNNNNTTQEKQYTRQTNNTTTHTYNYEQQKNKTNMQMLLLVTGGFLFACWYIVPPTKDPHSYQELQKSYDQLFQGDRYYTHKGDENSSALRRQNVIYQNQNVNDPPFVVQKRRTMMEEEMKQKKFTIQVEQFEKVIKGEVKSLQRKSKLPKKGPNRSPNGDLTIEGFAAINKLKLNKSHKEPEIQQITISHLEQGYI